MAIEIWVNIVSVWLVASLLQGISWTNVDLSPVLSSDTHLRAIWRENHQPSMSKISLNIYPSFHPNIPSVNELSWQYSLHWRHNDHDGVSNHQPRGCLLTGLFRRRSKKTSKLRVTGLCVGNSPGLVNSPHKGPVTQKMFPFDDVIMFACSSPQQLSAKDKLL